PPSQRFASHAHPQPSTRLTTTRELHLPLGAKSRYCRCDQHCVAVPGRHSMDHQVKYLLDESEMPRQWYNVIPDLPAPPPPPLHPGTGEPVGPEALAPLFPMALIAQEVSPDRFIDIPEAVTDVYPLWRPTPLLRPPRLEEGPGTAGRDLLQVGGPVPGGLAQAHHRRTAGVLQRRGGRHQAHHRDRRRPVGQRTRLRLGRVRARLRSVDGP